MDTSSDSKSSSSASHKATFYPFGATVLTKLELGLDRDTLMPSRHAIFLAAVDGQLLDALVAAPGEARITARRWVMEQVAGLEIAKPISAELRALIVNRLPVKLVGYGDRCWVAEHWQGVKELQSPCKSCDSDQRWSVGSLAEVLTSWVFLHGKRCAELQFYYVMNVIATTQGRDVRLQTAALLNACHAVQSLAVLRETWQNRGSPFDAVEFRDGMAILLNHPSQFDHIKVKGIGSLVAPTPEFSAEVDNALKAMKAKMHSIVLEWFSDACVLPGPVARVVIAYLD